MHDRLSFQRAGRCRYRAFDAFEQADADVHLEELEAGVHALLEALSHDCAIGDGVGIAIDQHFVAELTARQLIGRYAVGFAGQIKERHFDTADTTALPRMKAELLDLAEDLVDIAGVLAQQARLEHERISWAGAVAHFAIAAYALIGIQPQQRDIKGQRLEVDDAQFGDAQFGRAGVRVDV